MLVSSHSMGSGLSASMPKVDILHDISMTKGVSSS